MKWRSLGSTIYSETISQMNTWRSDLHDNVLPTRNPGCNFDYFPFHMLTLKFYFKISWQDPWRQPEMDLVKGLALKMVNGCNLLYEYLSMMKERDQNRLQQKGLWMFVHMQQSTTLFRILGSLKLRFYFTLNQVLKVAVAWAWDWCELSISHP